MTQLDEIFKRTSSGKIQTWSMEINGNKYRTVTGLQGGQKVVSAWTTCAGKNLGKKNATSPEEQALLEAMAKRKKKLEKEYKEDISQVDNIDYPEPMSAHTYKKGSFKGPAYIQYKFDGVRSKGTASGLFSRYGKPFVACPHITDVLAPVFAEYPDLVLDGELYNHSLKDDFDELISCIKQPKPTQADFDKSKGIVQYHVYDIMDTTRNFSERYKELEDIVTKINNPIIQLAPTYLVNTEEELDEYYVKFLEEGYEGQMIRQDAPYEHKRTNNLLKRKEFIDDEFELVDITEGKGNRAGMAGKVWIKLHQPTTEGVTTCEANPKGGNAFYKRLLAEKDSIIGKMCTIRFQNYTPKNSLRFPRMISIRDYE